MQSARSQLTTLQMLPWDACGINQTSQSQPNPPVNSTLGWCEQNCPGFQLSTFSQWSDLLTTFIVPAFAQLLLCPVGSGGEDEEEEDDEWREEKLEGSQDKSSATASGVKELTAQNSSSGHSVKKGDRKKKRVLRTIFYLVSEYIVLLGDPASAISGCFYQLWRDFVYVWQMTRKKPLGTFKEHVKGLAILAGQTTLQRTDEELGKLDVMPPNVDDMVNLVSGAILKNQESLSEKATNATTNANTSPPPGGEATSRIPADQTRAAPAQTRDAEKNVAAPNSPAAPKLESI